MLRIQERRRPSPHGLFCAPIVLFAYKRPAHTRRVLQTLAMNPLAGKSHLYIFCDGPRSTQEGAAVAEVRRLVRRHSWCGQVTVHERQTNAGLAQSIIAGVSEVLDRHEEVIVLEDDLELAPGFLEFMNAALERYRPQSRVMQISGYMFPVRVPRDQEAGFLPMISSWGWATWKRAWRHFDADLAGWQEVLADASVRRRFDLDGSYSYSRLLQQVHAGQADSWAVRWHLAVFGQRGLTLFPARSFVRNRGWDGSGTHCTPSSV